MRLTPSSTPLHVAGDRLADSAGNTVILRGVNVTGLESYPTGLDYDANGNSILPQVVNEALTGWHANLIRVTVYQDFWFGHDEGAGLGEAADGGASYRGLVDQIVETAEADGAYVMLAAWGSDMGSWGAAPALHDMPDQNTAAFWQSAAARYANNPTVMFDPFNEPHDVSWSQWLNGGSINEDGVTYQSPGMQGLLNVIRATGANNLVAPEGLGWATDLSGIDQGYALNDPAHSLMYQFHFYPDDDGGASGAAADAVRDNFVQSVAGQYPVYIGEWGTFPDGTDPGPDGANQPGLPDAATWSQDMLAWLNQHQYNWSAWAFNIPQNGGPNLISDWNYTPTDYFGAYVQRALATNTQPQTVATQTGLQASDANPSAGETVTLTATVSPQQTAYPGTPTGEVDFYDGQTLLGQVALQPAYLTVTGANWATATFSTSALTAGAHPITAVYEGGGAAENGETYAGSSSAAETVTVTATTGQSAAPVVAQFPGAGIWRFESATGWAQLTTADPTHMASDDRGDVIAEIAGAGVWRFEDATGWKQLTPADAALVALDGQGGAAVAIPGAGVWRFRDATGWAQLTTANPTQMVMDANGDVAVAIPGAGVWRHEDATGWKQLTAAGAAQLSIAGAGVVAVDIQGAGVWRFEDAGGWAQLTGADAAQVTVDANGDVATATAGGVRRFEDATGWQQLTSADAALMALDANGDVTVEIAGAGLWAFADSTGWAQLTPADASSIDG